MYDKVKLIVKIVRLLKLSHRLYARAEREGDNELLNFLDGVLELAEDGLNELNKS